MREKDRATIGAILSKALAERLDQASNEADRVAKEEIGDTAEFYRAGPEVVKALGRAATSALALGYLVWRPGRIDAQVHEGAQCLTDPAHEAAGTYGYGQPRPLR